MNDTNQTDVLFIGAGPASLAGAIKLKQLLNEKKRSESVVVIEKAEKLGQHSLSGAVFEADVLDELIPGWKEREDEFVTQTLANRVEKDETVFLLGQNSSLKLPEFLVPAYLRHKGDYAISLSQMVNWLAEIARGTGVEIYTGFAAKEILTEDGSVTGVKLGEKGRNKEGEEQVNYLPGETVKAGVTVLGEGSLGLLTEDLVKRFNLGNGRNPQVHSLGVKEIIRLPDNNNFGSNRVIHTMGFPNKLLTPDIFGGGTLYSMGQNTVAVALILALDWRYCDLDPQRELQAFKSHSLVKNLIADGDVIAYGAKTLPEGGYYSLPEPVTNGAVIIGDSAGFTSVRKLKGLHYAIKSGMLAAEAIFQAIEKQDFSRQTLKLYPELLENSFIMRDLKAGRNYRQVFTRAGRTGLYLGAPLSLVQQWLPARLSTRPDHEGTTRARLERQPDGQIDRLTAVSLSGTAHREEEPSHITFSDPGRCARCYQDYGCHPCESFCPGEVYKFEDNELMLSPSNCLHCQTCRVKCPHQVIMWEVPEGGDGPKYKLM
ncbi:MAG: 4Fe-4S dicluster domain-containing protein [Dehalococcoidales bacterium]|nr:MAG: 4Fe-4S dicluster domain-containing protein [Dehalococcoidales bacterium]